MNQSQIIQAFFAQLAANNPNGYPIAWPGVPFDPPAVGIWWEADFMPNQGIDRGLASTDGVVLQGLCQVIVWTRPGAGVVSLNQAAESLAAAFPKGSAFVGLVRVQRAPYLTRLNSEPDKVGVLVTIPYSG